MPKQPAKPTRLSGATDSPAFASRLRTGQQPGQTAIGAMIKRNPLGALAALAAKAKGKGRAK